MKKETLTLAIDTSCDETSASVVKGLTVLSNVLPSQNELHSKYGGVVPSIAKLAHQERIDAVVDMALQKAKVKMEDVDAIAVTIGPGLAIALEVGINKAKELAIKYEKPLIPINHMEGHLVSSFALQNSKKINSKTQKNTKIHFSSLGLLVSGKHTEIVLVNGIGDYEILGETLDDACGEAFDKCGRLLGFGYPAGPIVAKFAKENRKNYKITQKNLSQSTVVVSKNKNTGSEIELPLSMYNSKDLNFSYSGLKTAFRHLTEELFKNNEALTKEQIIDLCVVFEEAAFRPIIHKLEAAIKTHKPKSILLGGGVSSNLNLRKKLRNLAQKNQIELRLPGSNKLSTDNAAMIGVAANLRALNGKSDAILAVSESLHKIDRMPNLRLSN